MDWTGRALLGLLTTVALTAVMVAAQMAGVTLTLRTLSITNDERSRDR